MGLVEADMVKWRSLTGSHLTCDATLPLGCPGRTPSSASVLRLAVLQKSTMTLGNNASLTNDIVMMTNKKIVVK